MIGVAETHPGRHPTAARCADSVLAETPVLILRATCRAQVSRSAQQVELRRLLRGCEVTVLAERDAHAAGHLLGRAGTRDVVDAVVAHTAAQLDADVVTGNPAGIGRLLDAAGATSQIISL